MKINAKGIALAGIGSAISLVFVVLSHYLNALNITFNALAAAGTLVPLAKKHYKEALLGCVAVSLIGFFIVNISVIPFVLVGGFYTVFTVFWSDKNYSYLKSLPIKFSYSVLVFFILYKLISLISVDPSKIALLKNINAVALYLILNIVFSALFLVYDRALVYFFNYLKKRIKG
ncbi:MAG: hypothetical protein QM214_01815 [Bacillota bacterium]|jgi:hypothetical protein|nr:hypothetical protein [Bacillota bacterium]HHU43216.1 hypothetical protein [Clostridiales bacterium]